MKRYSEVSNEDVKKILSLLFQQNMDSIEAELIQLPKKYPQEKAKYEPLYKIYCGN